MVIYEHPTTWSRGRGGRQRELHLSMIAVQRFPLTEDQGSCLPLLTPCGSIVTPQLSACTVVIGRMYRERAEKRFRVGYVSESVKARQEGLVKYFVITRRPPKKGEGQNISEIATCDGIASHKIIK